jgi:hypothetical protein
VIAALAAIGGCSLPAATPTATVPLDPPSVAQAEEALERMVTAAAEGKFDELCAMGTGTCESILEGTGRDTVPAAIPEIMSNEEWDGGTAARLLVVCGALPSGRIYQTEMVVTWRGTEIVVLEPVYWSGMSVGPIPTMPAAEPSRVRPPVTC